MESTKETLHPIPTLIGYIRSYMNNMYPGGEIQRSFYEGCCVGLLEKEGCSEDDIIAFRKSLPKPEAQ